MTWTRVLPLLSMFACTGGPDDDSSLVDDPDAETDTDTDRDAETDTDPESDTDVETDVATDETDPVDETDTDEAETDTDEVDTDTDTVVIPDSDTATDTDTDPLPDCPVVFGARLWPTEVGCDAWPTAAGRLPARLTVSVASQLTAVGDVTGDGIDDLFDDGVTAVLRPGGGTVDTVLLRSPAASFQRLPGSRGYQGGDLNGDGLSDVVAWSSTQVVVWLAPVTLGETVASADFVLPTGPGSPVLGSLAVVGDLDGTAAQELVAVLEGPEPGVHDDRVVVVSLSGGAVTSLAEGARATWTGTVADDASDLRIRRVGDLSGDGRADLVVRGTGGRARTLYRLPWPSPGGTLSDAQWILPAPSAEVLAEVVAGDLDDDGDQDLVLIGDQGRVWGVPDPGPGRHAVEDVAAFTAGGPGMHAVLSAAVTDVDQDGLNDLVLGLPFNQAEACGETEPTWTTRRPGALALVRGPLPAQIDLASVDPILLDEPGGVWSPDLQLNLGDLTNDGRDDWIAGRNGWVEVPTCPPPASSPASSCGRRPLSDLCGAGPCVTPWTPSVGSPVAANDRERALACANDGPTCDDNGRILVSAQFPSLYRDAVLWFDVVTQELVSAYEDLPCGRRWYGPIVGCGGGTLADCADAGVCAAGAVEALPATPGDVCDVWPTGVVALRDLAAFGQDLTPVPDLTGDGIRDLLVSDVGASLRVQAGGMDLDHLLDEAPAATLDAARAAVGDVDGDGSADLVSLGITGLRVHRGPTFGDLTDATADVVLPYGARTLVAVYVPGDLDDDGTDEIVGLWSLAAIPSTTNAGELSVFALDARTWGGLANLQAAESAHWTGTGGLSGVHPIGDLDNDGDDELIVSQTLADLTGVIARTDAGKVWHLPYPNPGADFRTAPSVVGSQSDEQLGGHVAAADLDGDGSVELVLATGKWSSTAPALHIVRSIPAPLTRVETVSVASFAGDPRTQIDGLLITNDLDGDGVRDLLVSSGSAGRLGTCVSSGVVGEASSNQGGVMVVLRPLQPTGRRLADAGGAALASLTEFGSDAGGPMVDLTGVVPGGAVLSGWGWGPYRKVPSCP